MRLANFHKVDLAPAASDFLGDVLRGLRSEPKTLSPKYFYDAAGSALFDQICELPEYYVTRTELAIMDQLKGFKLSGPQQLAVIELGGASSFKFRRLRRSLTNIGKYIPVDISRDALFADAERLAAECPDLEVTAICADYQQLETFAWSELTAGYTPVVYFPGSTIGNLTTFEAKALLKICRRMLGGNGYMLLGCDLLKPLDILIPAYDDAQGVTAQFNLNILRRINAELGGDFNLEQFRHEIRFNQEQRKIEMHLVSLVDQTVHIANTAIHLGKGESIHTEDSRKFLRSDIEAIADAAGFRVQDWSTDSRGHFAVALLSTSQAQHFWPQLSVISDAGKRVSAPMAQYQVAQQLALQVAAQAATSNR